MSRPPIVSPADPRAQERLWLTQVERLRGEPDFEEHWRTFTEVYAARRPEDGPPPAWLPDDARRERANLRSLLRRRELDRYEELFAWSTRERAAFWGDVVDELELEFARRPEHILAPGGDVRDPRWLPGAELSCVSWCFGAEGRRPAILAQREGEQAPRVVSYAQLRSLVARVAAGVRASGFEPGDAIALYLPMTVECVATYLGVIAAGCHVVSIADSFPPAELRRRLEIGAARGLVCVESFERGGKRIPLYAQAVAADAPRTVVIGSTRPLARPGDLRFEDLLAAGGSGDLAAVAGSPETLINVLFSSGTTGTPKAIPWTHLTALKCAMDGRYHQDIHPDDVVAWPTNIGWMMGPWLIFATFLNRATLALYEGLPAASGFARFVAQAEVSVLGLVPSLVRAWRASGATEGVDWSRIRVFSSTGEASNARDTLWLMSRAGYRAPVIEYCGGTEIGGGYVTGSVLQPASPASFSTPALGLDFVVLDEAGRPVAPGEMGEAFVVPPSIGLSQRLLNADHDRVYYAGCHAGLRGERLRRHGDQITRLHGGYFRAQGRADDTMNLGGIKVGSLEIERVMDAHPGVHESAAIAVQPEGEGADALVLYVVAEPGDTDCEALRRELQLRLRTGLNPLFRIHDLVVVDALPRTASNKLMRRELRARYAKA